MLKHKKKMFLKSLMVFVALTLTHAAHCGQKMILPTHKVTEIKIITSLACPACKRFFEKKNEDIQAYCEENHIKISYEPFPVNEPTLLASSIAFSMGAEKAFDIYRQLALTQNEWQGKNWREKLFQVCTELGVPQETINIIMDRKSPIEDEILIKLKSLIQEHKIEYVPAILIENSLVVDADLKALKKGIEDFESGKVPTSNEFENIAENAISAAA